MAALEIYRSASIGRALTDALGEMVSSGKLDPLLALQVLLHFDESMGAALENLVTSTVHFKGNLRTYRYCDSVWTFNLKDVTFRNGDISEDIGKLKIVACDSNLLKPKVPPQE
ncbi:transcription initiation factor IIA subunit 2-like [Lolium perenne]|uniref:transcription initiation factor IIA subunit 2-like n=1 Tax=Lolium perenne TaxID=4522 RepID=UPI0021F5ACEC|nr:transcription initiation factor IIA subunit 2-like [Lolium perenne]